MDVNPYQIKIKKLSANLAIQGSPLLAPFSIIYLTFISSIFIKNIQDSRWCSEQLIKNANTATKCCSFHEKFHRTADKRLLAGIVCIEKAG